MHIKKYLLVVVHIFKNWAKTIENKCMEKQYGIVVNWEY